MFCKHDWETISEVTLPSAFEQMAGKLSSLKGWDTSMFVKKHVLVIKCKKCGKLHKFESENP